MTRTDELTRKAQETLVAISDARHLLHNPEGRRFLKHLLVRLDILFMPSERVTGEELAGIMGRLRVGNEIFQLLSRADRNVAGALLAEIEGERSAYADAEIKRAIEDER